VRGVCHLARLHGVTVGCLKMGISRATFYRWSARLERGSVEALEPSSRRPKRPRAPTLRRTIAVRVEQLREHASTGKEALCVLLAREGVMVSPSTIGRCLRELFARGVIEQYRPRGRIRVQRRRAVRPHAVRTPRLAPLASGDVVQVDTVHVRWGSGSWGSWRHFSAIDVTSRYAHARSGHRARSSDARAFLLELVPSMPFPIRAIQVDGGSEFMDAFEQTCAELGITLYVNRPKNPRQNAFVERFNRTVRDEFYRRVSLPADPVAADAHLKTYLEHYNHVRPHAGLRYRTPAAYLHLAEPPHTSQMSWT
jgi:putative transposase